MVDTSPTMKTYPPASLTQLPLEILQAICNLLCLHCRVPHLVDLPHGVLEAASEDKRALARLSRVCKGLRVAVQPFVFHYYYSGNFVPMVRTSSAVEDEAYRWDALRIADPEDDMMIPFLRSAVERPDLAASVKALALFIAPALAMTRQAVITPGLAKLFIQAGRSVGLQVEVAGRLDPVWLQELAILLLPSVEQLAVDRTGYQGFCYLRDSPHQLPSLTYLAVVGVPRPRWYSDYHFGETEALLRLAPNLEVLAAADCGAQSDRDLREGWEHTTLGVPFDRLRRLSLNGVPPIYLAKILAGCPVLEDLEYYYPAEPASIATTKDLRPLRSTLRRLCYSIADPWLQTPDFQFRELHTPWYASDPVNEALVTNDISDWDLSFAEFPALEHLEIEQVLLCGPVSDYERRQDNNDKGHLSFIAKLPPLLRVLHVGLVVQWDEMRRDLLGLTRETSRFPHLRAVRVDTYMTPHPDDIATLTSEFGASGIEFQHGPVPKSSWARGMLGARPGHPELVKEPSVLFSL